MTENIGEQPFWQTVPLELMNTEQWESLCDGCGRCCLHKLECEDSGDVFYTDVACRNLDCEKGGCVDYPRRQELVPECLVLKFDDVKNFHWLPSTCAYRLLSEGKPLFEWHPLISKDAESVVRAGISVRGRVLKEQSVDENELEERIIHWVT